MTLPTLPSDLCSYASWETAWAPYDQATYEAVLDFLRPADAVIEIGAGDLRLACQMAARVRQVTAIEINSTVLALAPHKLPVNLHVVCGDARTLAYPRASVGVLLMRHCTHFPLYVTRLRSAGCSRLVTNARWRMGVELLDLELSRLAYALFQGGWYACSCGAVGFKACSPDDITSENAMACTEVSACPACAGLVGAEYRPPKYNKGPLYREDL